ncbi:MAG: peptidase domain-containing ABC transporter [Alphaproteobacteria bacterium]|nr:peptidase domain-containing ABC transporter [Alphaproteobacteria bacterium]
MRLGADLLNLTGGKRVPLILQTEAAECGLAALAMVAGYHGLQCDLSGLRRQFSLSLKGMTLKTLIGMADQLGLAGRALRLDLEHVPQLHLPAILHWEMNHFVVLTKAGGGKYSISDPARGERVIGNDEFSRAFTGVALELRPTSNFKTADLRERLRITQLWTRIEGLGSALAQTVFLSLLLQAFVIASPFYLQIVIDDILPRFDLDLLAVLAVGFGLFALINGAAGALRQRLILTAGSLMGFQMAANLARHLLKLPIPYFEKRHAGDIISRFGSIIPIQSALTTGIVGAIIDGLMALVTLILMFFYSTLLGLIATAAVGVALAMRAALFPIMKARSAEAIVTQAKQDSYLIETVRGVTALRLAGAESDRHALWQNKMAETANAKLSLGRLSISFQLVNDVLFGIEHIVTIYLAARLAFDGGFSVGMIFAFLTYKQQFVTRATALADRWIEFRMLSLHLERLADIALTDQDRGFERQPFEAREGDFKGAIALDDIKFRYAPSEPYVLDGLSLNIAPGEHVAITGPSAGGKSTLVKIILGLMEPEAGEVLIDGEPLTKFGLTRYRKQVAAVMQDDQLFAGSLADNIALFDPKPDTDRVESCAKTAAIHDEIIRMPMRYETLVGDMGAALSGGQKQRVLLARALYRQPKILVLDEGTAHLDTELETRVSNAIASLNITRIVIAHRPETIRRASRAVLLAGGKIHRLELGGPPAMGQGDTIALVQKSP